MYCSKYDFLDLKMSENDSVVIIVKVAYASANSKERFLNKKAMFACYVKNDIKLLQSIINKFEMKNNLDNNQHRQQQHRLCSK